jgi:hypothetical protein
MGMEIKVNAQNNEAQSYGAAFLKKYSKAKMITVAARGGDISLEEFVTMPVTEILTRAQNTIQ